MDNFILNNEFKFSVESDVKFDYTQPDIELDGAEYDTVFKFQSDSGQRFIILTFAGQETSALEGQIQYSLSFHGLDRVSVRYGNLPILKFCEHADERGQINLRAIIHSVKDLVGIKVEEGCIWLDLPAAVAQARYEGCWVDSTW